MAREQSDGAHVYGAADRVDRYLQHRYDPARSPNLTIEEPAFHEKTPARAARRLTRR